MPSSSSAQRSWKWQALALVISVLQVTSAAPVEVASAADSASVAVPSDITQARVKQVQASSSNKLSLACCTLLKIGLGGIVSDPGSPTYEASTQSYFSVQAQSVDPWCIVSPASTLDVQKTVGALNILRTFGLVCPFAIRSGGHTPHTGAATIENGVTVSLAALNQVTVSSNKKTVSVGPGARWLDAYSKLDPQGLTIVGGRVATVGVGGLVTGGGISFFSGRYGFAVDNVQTFEVVLYDGSVITASATSRPDLFFALKGGSSNFGIVTRFDTKAYVQAPFLGGQIVHPYSAKAENLAAFAKFTGQPNYDVYGALINSYAYSAASGWVIANNIQYTKADLNPPAFQNFTAIQPQYVNTLRIGTLSEFTLELAASNPAVKRQIFYTSTWGNDLDLLTQIVDSQDSFVAALSGVIGLSWSFSLQPLVTAITKVAATTGGNALGLDASDGNLVLGLITASWLDSADDAAVTDAVTRFYAQADALAASKGKLNQYKYLNYAYKTQEPIKGYGATNVAKLRAASKKYDPYGVFQTQVPGGFKL